MGATAFTLSDRHVGSRGGQFNVNLYNIAGCIEREGTRLFTVCFALIMTSQLSPGFGPDARSAEHAWLRCTY